MQLNCDAQLNLILNPSFEDTASMTSGYPFLITENWWSPNGFDPDYYTPFCNELCCGSGVTYCSNEITSLGYQLPQNGSAYMGLVIYESTGDTKDYAQGFLSEPLIAGNSYCVSIWISLADSSSFQSCDFQMAFTEELIHDSELNNLFLQDYVSFDLSSIDTSSWSYFQGTYIANGGEMYIYLGSNSPNDELTCVDELDVTWLNNASYILVDNVSVQLATECDTYSPEYDSETDVKIYYNSFTGLVQIIQNSKELCVVKIYDLTGSLCKSDIIHEREASLDVNELSQGVYLSVVENVQGNWVQRIAIN